MNHTPTTNQFVCVLNNKVPIGNAMNAVGHMTAGLVAQHKDITNMRFQAYV